MDFRSMAEAALDRRAALHETYRSIRAKHDAAKDAGKSDAAKAHRDHLDALEADMDDLAAEARQYVEQAEAEQNRAAGKDHAERSHVLRLRPAPRAGTLRFALTSRCRRADLSRT